MGFFRNMGRGEQCCTDCGQATPCEPCCPTTLPALEWRSRSASKSKCGFAEFAGYVSNPPARYLTRTTTRSYDRSRTIDRTSFIPMCCFRRLEQLTITAGGVSIATYDPVTGVLTPGSVPSDGTITETIQTSWSGSGSETSPCPSETTNDTETTPIPWFYIDLLPGAVTSTNYTSTSYNYSASFSESAVYPGYTEEPDFPTRCSDGYLEGSGNASIIEELSDEFTTSALIEITQEALPEDWPNTTAGSLRNLATTELTYSTRESQWRVTAPADLVAGRTYRLIYSVRFTPASGPAEDGPEQILSVPGEDAGEPTAWQALAVPETNGTHTIVLLRWECEPFDE